MKVEIRSKEKVSVKLLSSPSSRNSKKGSRDDVVMDLDSKGSCDGDAPPAGTSSPLVAAMSTVNLVVGVGILYLPNTFVQCGMIPAVLISAVVAYSSWYTSQLIVRIGMKIKKYTYEEICQVVLGDAGYISLAVSCIASNWGAGIAYMLTLKTLLCKVIARHLGNVEWVEENMPWLATPEFFFLILCLPPLWGLSLLKDLSALSFASIIKAVVVSLTVITVFITSQTSAVQNTLEFTKWEPNQVRDFFKDVTDGDHKKDDNDPEADFLDPVSGKKVPIYEDLVTKYQDDLTKLGGTDQDIMSGKMALAWKLVDDVDTLDGFTHPKKVRQALREMVNRENPRPRVVEYEKKGEHKEAVKDENTLPEKDRPKSNQQPPGMFNRLTYFSPYLFCSNFYLKLGTICFAFVFHDSIFSVYKQLEDPTPRTWRKTSIMFIAIIFGIQVLFACITGLTFGTSTPDNVLTSSYDEGAVFPADNAFSQIIQIAFSIVLLLTYPACIVICREFVESIIVLYKTPAADGSREFARMTQLIIASILVVLTIPFLFFPAAGEIADMVLDFVGGLACGYMAFVLPSFLYWKVYGLVPAKGEERSTTDRIMPYAVLVLGFYACIVSPILTILGWCGVTPGMPQPPQGWNTPNKLET